jgi:acyl-CoA synthetase (AMP-forming)/AMP-acid ligase II
MTTLVTLLLDPPDGSEPDDVVVAAGDDRLTRVGLEHAARELADALRDAGVARGQPVAVMLPNTPAAVVALFGVWLAEAVHVPLNPRLADAEVARLLEAVRPAAVVTTADHTPRFPALPTLTAVPEALTYRIGTPGSPERAAATHDGDVALIQLTSGTTGAAKPVLLTHSGVLGLMDGVLRKVRGADGARKKSSTPNLLPVSLSVWAGIYNVCFAFRVGAPVVLMERFESGEFARLVAEHQVTSVVLPPAAMAMLADDPAITTLEPLRWVRSISAPLSPFLARRFHDRFGTGILNSYGQTELGGEVVGWNAADWREWGSTKLGAVGRPHEGVDVKEVDGELWLRAPSRSAGYADGRALDDRVTDDGWFRTGDVGHVDDDGFVWIEGRVSDQINRGGMKIVPAEVEEVLAAAPGVREVAVAGVPDERLGEVPVAFVVLTDAAAAVDTDALTAHCREHLSPWKVPARFVRVGSLPRNDAGKILRKDLVAQEGTARA